jgi:predicted nucleic acid-binding protein
MFDFVLDASVTLAWFMPDEQNPVTSLLLRRAENVSVFVPILWRLEVGNILLIAQRQKRITATQRVMALHILTGLSITEDVETTQHAWTDSIILAEKHRLTLYDAAYLELAQRRGLPLATLDQDLRAAAEKIGVELLGK